MGTLTAAVGSMPCPDVGWNIDGLPIPQAKAIIGCKALLVSATTPPSSHELADLPQVAVGIRKEAPDLGTPVVWRREEFRAPLFQRLVCGLAALDADRERVADMFCTRRAELDIRFVRSGRPTLHEKEPGSVETHHGRCLVLPITLRSENLVVPKRRSMDVGDDQDVSQRHIWGWERSGHGCRLAAFAAPVRIAADRDWWRSRPMDSAE
jgi:hypothetical protein